MNQSVLTNFTGYLPDLNTSFSFPGRDLPTECLISTNQYNAQCLSEWFCPQMPQHFVTVGLTLIIGYIVLSWLLWYYMKYGYKYIPESKYFGDFNNYNTRVYWLDWFKSRVIALFLGFTVLVVWWSW